MNISYRARQHGISLIEVLIAVVVLSFGLLALASLQAQLFRAGAESKSRAMASSLAQQQLESLRTFLDAGGTGDTYEQIATGALAATTDAGVTYYGCTQVRRFVYDSATGEFVGPSSALPDFSVTSAGAVTCQDGGSSSGAVLGGVPEFKEVTVSYGWFDQAGQLKTIQLKDTVAAVSPKDSLLLVNVPNLSSRGPSVWITPPSEVGVVPIALGSDTSAASSNPKPEQFVDDLSSVTTFSVQTFTGSASSSEVLLNRKLNVAAISCVCQDNGAVSSATNQAYEPTYWNGKQLSYVAPARAPDGKRVGSYNGSNANAEIKTMCTVCCRDHHDSRQSADQRLKADPYRSLVSGAHQHYGFAKNGNNYDLQGGLLPVGTATSNEYVEACRLIRVGGVMRLAVDARQYNMAVTPVNVARDDFQVPNFIDKYSDFVRDYTEETVTSAVAANYPSGGYVLPAPSADLVAAHPDVLSPSNVLYTESAGDRKLVSFGLYIDYLTPDTIEAFNCARANNNSGDCAGLGDRDPLEYIPFYAVNLASLGGWSSANALVAQVDGAIYNNQGSLTSEGGIVHWGTGSSSSAIPIQEQINVSNSGLTSTMQIDPDDAGSSSFVIDALGFLKEAGAVVSPPVVLAIQVADSSSITLSKVEVTSPAGITSCARKQGGARIECAVPAAALSTSVRVSNYTTQQGQSITNRKVCVPTSPRVTTPVVSGDGTVSEFADFTLTGVNTVNSTLTIAIVDQSTNCPALGLSLNP